MLTLALPKSKLTGDAEAGTLPVLISEFSLAAVVLIATGPKTRPKISKLILKKFRAGICHDLVTGYRGPRR